MHTATRPALAATGGPGERHALPTGTAKLEAASAVAASAPSHTGPLDDDAAYRAWATHDARFDGRVFAGVTSTGIYCRPVCRVRLPRREHMRFYANAASAEAAGFRPCLRCRPELAPGLSLVDSSQVLAQQAARMLEHAVRTGEALSLPQTARRLGVSERHLRRIFQHSFGVKPIDYRTTQRLLLAKQLLTDTRLPVAQVALLSGFDSLRRFNAVFQERVRLAPSALRRASLPAAAALPDALRLRLGYRPPYDIDALFAFLARRQVEGLERIEPATRTRGPRWLRSLACGSGAARRSGWLALEFLPLRNELEVQLAPALASRLGDLVECVRRGLDLDADPEAIGPALASMGLGSSGVRVPGAFDGFEAAVRIVLGQQVSTAAARTLTQRLLLRFGEPIATPWPGVERLFPTPSALADAEPAEIGTLGIVRQRVAALQHLARAVREGHIALHRGAPLDATLDALRALPGIGEWTVQLIAMRALGWPDAWPRGDLGLCMALGTRDPTRLDELSRAWTPWRAYAAMRLWQHLELPA